MKFAEKLASAQEKLPSAREMLPSAQEMLPSARLTIGTYTPKITSRTETIDSRTPKITARAETIDSRTPKITSRTPKLTSYTVKIGTYTQKITSRTSKTEHPSEFGLRVAFFLILPSPLGEGKERKGVIARQALSPALSQREREMKEDPPATAGGTDKRAIY
ncbi:MAG TPA: hypothetical protein VF899_19125 [Pyrinomonadaceae bacterium]